MKKMFAVAALALVPSSGVTQDMPQDIPRYDVDGMCRAWSNKFSGSGSDFFDRICIENNQSDYDTLRTENAWRLATKETREECARAYATERDEVKRLRPYLTIRACINQRAQDHINGAPIKKFEY